MIKTNIFFVVPDLYSGGAQRVFMNLVKGFSRDYFEITLVILIKPENKHFAKLLPTDIRVLQYNFAKTSHASIALLSLIKKEKPDIVFSTLTHLNFILGIIKFFVSRKILFVARESSIISWSIKDEKFSRIFQFFYGWVYEKLDLIICQSKAMADDLTKNFKLKESSIRIIYNPVDLTLISNSIPALDRQKKTTKEIRFLCVGRLYAVKGYDRLLKTLSMITDLDYSLKIVGDGPLRKDLGKLCTELRLDTKVEFLGIQENPFQFMAESDCLLLASYYEGLPNVALEANACGLPVIAFNAPGGTAEIIVDGLNGWLIADGDLEAFAKKLLAREYLSVDRQKIKAFVTEKFSLTKITGQYEDAILSLRKY